MKRGVNRPKDRRILKIILLGFRIQSEISTDLRILNLQRFAVSSIFWVRILDFACEEVRIVDRKGCQKCVVSGYVYFFVTAGRDSLHVTHQGNNNELMASMRKEEEYTSLGHDKHRVNFMVW